MALSSPVSKQVKGVITFRLDETPINSIIMHDEVSQSGLINKKYILKAVFHQYKSVYLAIIFSKTILWQ